VAIVTGGASGIGAATVRRFVAEGARVVIADVNDAGGEALAADLGRAAAFRHTDVGVLPNLEATVGFAVERFGGLDVIHNNAAMSGGGYVADVDPEVWEQSLRVMLTGVFYGMRAAIPAMLARGGGSIISTSSVEGFFGEVMAAPYATAKAAVLNLTRTVAVEYGRKGIRANCICPGAVEGDRIERVIRARAEALGAPYDEVKKNFTANAALQRMVTEEEVARVALFVVSDLAAGVTGQTINVDAGNIMN
jgi:NAD(P)-dependent dehydrogenase (short-subunit alcohol dehydrogenase family)